MNMRYLDRKIGRFLAEWKSVPQRKPLIVEGSWQIGKTESAGRFAEHSYKSVIYINFVEEPRYKLITADGYKTNDIVKTSPAWTQASRRCFDWKGTAFL